MGISDRCYPRNFFDPFGDNDETGPCSKCGEWHYWEDMTQIEEEDFCGACAYEENIEAGRRWQLEFMRMKHKPECKHPPSRTYSWFAFNCETGKNDILCVGCCDCGKVLSGTL